MLPNTLAAVRRPSAAQLSLALFLFACGVGVALGVRARGSAAQSATSANTTTQALAGNNNNASAAPVTKVIPVKLTPRGFEPSEVSLPHEDFVLAVTNRSGLLTPTFRLQREQGQSLKDVRLPRGKRGFREKLKLPPGTYLLTEAGHAAFSCRIVVSNR
jgi:hypothetical protein